MVFGTYSLGPCTLNDTQLPDLTDFLKRCFHPSLIATVITMTYLQLEEQDRMFHSLISISPNLAFPPLP